MSSNILAFSVGLFYNSLYRSMRIKATVVAYAFPMQYFENATIVAYVSLRVKCTRLLADTSQVIVVILTLT